MKLSDICLIQSGGTPSRSKLEYWNNGNIPWVKISDMKGKYLTHTEEAITELGLNSSSAKLFKKGTLLYTIFATLGEVSVLDIDATTNQAIAGLTIVSPLVNQDYLYYFLISLKDQVNRIGRGVAQNNINMSILKNFEVPIPSMEEQQEIASTLATLDTIISDRIQEINKFDELVKSRFIELFGDPITNSKGLKTNALKDVLVLKAGDFTAASDISDEQTAEYQYPCYGGNGIRGYVTGYNQEGAYSLIGRQGALSGNVQYAKGRFRNTEHALLVTPTVAMNSIWLNQLLINLDLKRYQTGAAQPGLSVKNLQEIPIISVVLSEQNAFAAFVEQVDKSKFEIQQSLEKLETLKKALMQKYFG